ncbi:MAG TPA: hypothetical protein VGF50_01805 [Caulobacteraceae bacterium]
MKLVAAVLFTALLALPSGAAADRPAPAPKLPEITVDDTMAGMQVAPDLVREAALDCRVSDARRIGYDERTGGAFYELACRGGEGFIVAAPKPDPKQPPQPLRVYSCLEATSAKQAIANGAGCRLAENADPKAGIAALVAAVHPGCRMTDARAIGHTDAATMLEVACAGGGGFIVQASYPLSGERAATFTPCAGYQPGMTLQCVLTPASAADAYLAGLVAKAGKPCQLKTHRYVGLGVGLSDTGDAYFEVACQGGTGFMLDVDAAGNVYPTPCDQAGYMAGGCKLTKTR